jgi:hypothetical protein
MHDNVIFARFGHEFAYSIGFDYSVETLALQSKEPRCVIPARRGRKTITQIGDWHRHFLARCSEDIEGEKISGVEANVVIKVQRARPGVR